MSDVKDWDVSAANNNSSSPNGWPENMPPSGVNNSARENMAAVKRWYDDIGAVNTSGGSSNAYTLTAAQTITAYAAGQWFAFQANHTNTGAATLSVDSVGAKSIKKNHDEDLVSGDITANQIVVLYYQATDDVFELVNPHTGLTRSTADALYQPLGAIRGINNQAGNYTLQASDAGRLVRMTSATDVTVTVPDVFTINDYVHVEQQSTGVVTFAGDIGVTLQFVSDVFVAKTLGRFAIVTILFVPTTNPRLTGQLALA